MLNISYHENSGEFHLFNDKISYFISIMKNGQMGHLYFGKRVRERDSFGHFQQLKSLSHTAYLYDDDFLLSLDVARQEYPSYGMTDYRDPAFRILQPDGSCISDFKFKSFRVFDGKEKLPGLPATYAEPCESSVFSFDSERGGAKAVPEGVRQENGAASGADPGLQDSNSVKGAGPELQDSNSVKGAGPELQDSNSVKGAGPEAKTLEITLSDEKMAAELILSYTIFEKYGAVCRSARIVNRGSEPLRLDRAMSLSVDLYDDDFVMMQLDGSWSRERHVNERRLVPGVQSVSSSRGYSSAEHNPFFALRRPDATESRGEVYGFNLLYSGNFLSQVEVSRFGHARVMTGINPFGFLWNLEPGESFCTPEAVMAYSDEGIGGMSREFHALFNERLVRGKWRGVSRPVLLNNWEGTYFNFDEEKILSMAKDARELGVELFVLDDGWFGHRDDGTSSLGDWYSDLRKLPEGVEGLSKKIAAMGLEFGLWFEPEMVNADSELYRAHPEWAIHTPGRPMSQGRNQYVLDFSNPEVVNHIYAMMEKILRNSEISYVKWDLNRDITEPYGMTLPPERQGEFFHRYTLGVYALYERLNEAFPDILFESCASGGARFDAGLLYYAPQCWASDDTDAVERLKIQYGTSLAYPVSSIGAHVSAVPNHQLLRVTSLDMRANVAFFGAFGYELDSGKLTEEEREEIKKQIAFYKEYREIFQFGSFYRLLSPFEGKGNTAWMAVSPDRRKAVLAYYKVLARPNPGNVRILLQGLSENALYRISRFGKSGGGVAAYPALELGRQESSASLDVQGGGALDASRQMGGNSAAQMWEPRYGDELMRMGFLPEKEFSGSTVRNPKITLKDSGTDKGDFTAQLYVLEAV